MATSQISLLAIVGGGASDRMDDGSFESSITDFLTGSNKLIINDEIIIETGYRFAIEFDLSSLPTNATITSVQLRQCQQYQRHRIV